MRLSPLPHFPTSLTFLHEGTLLAWQVELQRGVSGWRGQVQASGFVSTNETDSDSEAFLWAPNHGLHCCGHHCGRVGVKVEETGGQGRAATRRRGTLGIGGEVKGAARAEVGMGLLTQAAGTEAALQGDCTPALLWAGDTGCI